MTGRYSFRIDLTTRAASAAVVLSLLVAMTVAPVPAAAQGVATRSLPVSVNVVQSCNVAASPMVFSGLLGPVNRDSTAAIALRCSPNVAFVVDIDDGLHPQGINRRVRSVTGANFLNYEVYKDAARSSRWGAGTPRNQAGNSGASGLSTLTAYGRLQGAGLILGQYSDSLTVTVAF